jgi:hypothetical protein
MGFTTHLWKCNKCNEQILYTSKQKHPSINHKCKNKMSDLIPKYSIKQIMDLSKEIAESLDNNFDDVYTSDKSQFKIAIRVLIDTMIDLEINN